MDVLGPYLGVAGSLDSAGLVWRPEIGDEISPRVELGNVSILVDPDGMSVKELRQTYLWLPTIEQLIQQFEVRQAIIFHAGLELGDSSLVYKTVVQTRIGNIESSGESMRVSLGLALFDLLQRSSPEKMH